MILLTGTTQAEVVEDPIELINGALSGLTLAGIFTSLAVIVIILAFSVAIAYKWRGNAGGAMMAFILGAAGAIVGDSVATIIFSLFGGTNLIASSVSTLILVGFIVYAILRAGADFGVRFYMLTYADKTGIGKHKGLSLACGYAAGSVIRYIRNYIYILLYAFSIKKGTFVTETLEEMKSAGQDAIKSYNARVNFQNALISSPQITYFMNALQFVAVAGLYVFLTMFMVRKWLENDKLNSSFKAAAIALGFELARTIPEWLRAAGIIDESTEYIILCAVFVVVIVICAVFLKRIMTDFPQGREKFIKPMRQRAEEAQAKQQRRTWNQINEYIEKNASENMGDEETPETETSEGNESLQYDGTPVKTETEEEVYDHLDSDIFDEH